MCFEARPAANARVKVGLAAFFAMENMVVKKQDLVQRGEELSTPKRHFGNDLTNIPRDRSRTNHRSSSSDIHRQ